MTPPGHGRKETRIVSVLELEDWPSTPKKNGGREEDPAARDGAGATEDRTARRRPDLE